MEALCLRMNYSPDCEIRTSYLTLVPMPLTQQTTMPILRKQWPVRWFQEGHNAVSWSVVVVLAHVLLLTRCQASGLVFVTTFTRLTKG